MRSFSADDKNPFHGREREITELVDRLRVGEREVFVIGPSGSGKSSLVTAGVLPRLARGVKGLGPCVTRELRPGEQPAKRLSEAFEVAVNHWSCRIGWRRCSRTARRVRCCWS
jgi:hypothetical protein